MYKTIRYFKFKSLSVLDFFEETKEWKEEDFKLNCLIHKNELDSIDVDDKRNPLWGCGSEILHLIDFIRKCLFYKDSGGTYPAGMSDVDYHLMLEIFNHLKKIEY